MQRALSAGPANARFWLEYARLSIQRGLERRAQRAVRRALELSPDYAEARELQRQLVPESAIAAPIEEEAAVDEPAEFSQRTSRFDWGAIESELTVRGVVRVPA